MPTLPDLKEAFKDTGLNLAVVFSDPEHSDPVASQWVVWHLRHKKDPTVKLEDVTYFTQGELRDAVTDFFQKPGLQGAVSMTGSPESTSASADSAGASPTSIEQI